MSTRKTRAKLATPTKGEKAIAARKRRSDARLDAELRAFDCLLAPQKAKGNVQLVSVTVPIIGGNGVLDFSAPAEMVDGRCEFMVSDTPATIQVNAGPSNRVGPARVPANELVGCTFPFPDRPRVTVTGGGAGANLVLTFGVRT